MTEENKNIVGDIVSIEKVGEEVLITKEVIVDDLNYADPNSKDVTKPDYIVTGVEESTRVQRFANKANALEHYTVQLKNCKKGLGIVKDGMAELEKDVMDAKIFDSISKIKGQLVESKYKGKYKALDVYMEKHAHYKQGLAQVEIRSKHIPFFETILEHIGKL